MKVLVGGAGIAGLVTAMRAHAIGHDVEVLVKGVLGDGCTAHAQGGIAGAYGPGDSAALHALDTMHAGNGHGDARAIAALVDGATAAIAALVDSGTPFDRTHDGALALGLEAAHSLPRIAHAGGDATGAAISQALITRLRATTARVREGAFATDLIIENGRVCGIRSLDGTEHRADAVVLATGGAGQLFSHTTNPAEITGDGIAMALRAGALVDDLEFVQFHPTVLAGDEPFLISEAVRGAGAVLVDADGRRFMLDEHPDAELAPRDVVARAVAQRAQEHGMPVLLDATALGGSALAQRFPTIDAELRRRGIDWSHVPVPITPAAHYLMGGVVTDIDGRTSLPGLWAVGETARTGVHGANRLASNSLLEGAVFGAGAAESLAVATASPFRSRSVPPDASGCGTNCDRNVDVPPFSRRALQQLMWERVGLRRETAGLEEAVATLEEWQGSSHSAADPVTAQEDANLLAVAHAMASAALRRTDSLGAHFRATADSPALIGVS
ncbi:L-aspartate oxidase [Microbacterium esteraromaticum]|uniref:L-aspartate oxidase n=1 Tax=Microbacterium esteraromaticum TaxID=57043 RepID=A0A1R4JCD7_9MICO|nr:L-aspartate oxidase [Microbacterium esteraromaticum]SJN29696.1 L-aspartate oxidase [Microbacterium esteraromaticum]